MMRWCWVVAALSVFASAGRGAEQKPADGPMAGYVLISPLRGNETYLLDSEQRIVHRWKSKYPPGASTNLLPNGDLLRCGRDPEYSAFNSGGVGGIIERFNWDGELVWTFRYQDQNYCGHHDVALLPNGNVLMVAWERKSKDEAIAAGRDPSLIKDDLWPDHVVEIQPEGRDGGKVVWEWHMWDHLVQDFDREKPNFGVVYEHPELIDLNSTGSTPPATPEELRKLRSVGYTGGGDDDDDKDQGSRQRADWIHTNAINYNPQLDQIALSAKHFSEIWIIDHSTTREESASHEGGKSGKGGDLLYRWGNPWAYKSGALEDKKLFDQHDVRWIPPGFPGAGHITAFNNGMGREFSTVIEIAPPINEDGEYELNDEGRYGPDELVWEYKAENPKDFYSSFISGATRLANGNTIACEGAKGRISEINSAGQVVWQFVSPYGGELSEDGRPIAAEEQARKLLTGGEKPFVDNNALFRAAKYPVDYAAFKGKKLEPVADQPVPFAKLVDAATAKLKAEGVGAEPADKKPSDDTDAPAAK